MIVVFAVAVLFGIMFYATSHVKGPVIPRNATPIPYKSFLPRLPLQL